MRVFFYTEANLSCGTGHLARTVRLARYFEGRSDLVNVYGLVDGLNLNPLCNSLAVRNPCSLPRDLEQLRPQAVIVDIPGDRNLVLKPFLGKVNSFLVSVGHPPKKPDIFDLIFDLYPEENEIQAGVLHGPEYVVLDPVWFNTDYTKQSSEGAFVCFGGVDPFDLTTCCVETLANSGNFSKIHVVLGAGCNADQRRLKSFAANQIVRLEIHRGLDQIELKSVMAQCAQAVTSFGTIAFEAVSQNIPTSVIAHYKYQSASAVTYANMGCFSYLGCAESDYAGKQDRQIAFGVQPKPINKHIIDGQGASRIYEELNQYLKYKCVG